MRRIKKAAGIAAAVLMLIMLAGCGDVAFEPTVPSLYVDKDGSISAADIESFDNSAFGEERYTEADLRTFVEQEVTAYNQEKAGISEAYAPEVKKGEDPVKLPVAISSLAVEENRARLILDYANCDDYLAFTKADDTVTGILFANALQASQADVFPPALIGLKGEAVDLSKYYDSEKAYLVSVIGKTQLVVNGKIIGCTDNAEMVDDHTVNIDTSEAASVLFK